jgi:predicted glutamine amidotransferase
MCRIFAMAAGADLHPLIKSRLLRGFFQCSAEDYSGGWGIGYFTDEGPMVMKEPIKATDSFALPGAIRRVEPGFFMAHVRNPTSGERNVLNTHPFSKDGWLFSHNGTLGDPDALRGRLLERYSQDLRGSTDSEVMFHCLLQRIEQAGQAEAGILGAVRDMSKNNSEGTSSLNFALTDGTVLFAVRKAFINDSKYSLNYVTVAGLDLVRNEQVPNDEGSTMATVVSSDPFIPGDWRSLEMGEMLIATAEGSRTVKI